PPAVQSRRFGLSAATIAIPAPSTPHPHSQSAAAEAGDRELNNPRGRHERRKYEAPVPSQNTPQIMDANAHRFVGVNFAVSLDEALRASNHPPPTPAISQKMKCSHGNVPPHLLDPKSNKKCAGPQKN